MGDGKIHIPARKRSYVTDGKRVVVRISAEAYNALIDLYNESTLCMADLASLLILGSADRVVFDKEEKIDE